MVATGIAIPSVQHIAFMALIAFVGTINPTTGDIGAHVPLEQAALAHGTSDQDRTRTFARYSLVGALSIAAGALAAGAPDALVSLGMDRIAALQAMFYGYGGLGLIGALFYSRLARTAAQETASRATTLGPSRRTVYKLAALFSLDSFAGGFVVQSLLALWLFERFELSLAAASAFFFWSNVLTAFSYPIAARLGERFGLVNTMVFTHIPSSICLMLAAFSPDLTDRPCPAAGALGAVADGRADTHVLRDGSGHSARAGRCRQHHRSPAQSSRGDQPHLERRVADDLACRPAAGDLRRAQDRL